MRFKSKQEMQHILRITVGHIIHACIGNLKYVSTIEVRQDLLSKKD